MPHPSLPTTTIHYTTQPSPLLRLLPAEIRELIFQHAYADVMPTQTEIPISRIHEFLPSPALLYTCKQIYAEARWCYLMARWRFGREKWILVGEERTLGRGEVGGEELLQGEGRGDGDGVDRRGRLVKTEMADGRTGRW
ncbi:hypothetical protein M409DRAFT_57254 [Zasmidium cellare ATCC 36951]|uniref:F-box domain-containing protein n=1 Tax=Zasmidium cellare ATCC 36951 TaxID=1080233 RepID=A0A6A6C9P9_ZASCE|nr:uncharacterized protein M409DRAFT_57254 [Zasmidium cellare ATCC 36951]KAF2163771.1 hypothetical protein M409DRAFT_57254 [Zasmidium cellare ATCC 36951]